MPITGLDPVTALLVVDLQVGIVSLPTVHPASDVVRRARDLADAFRAARLPVVLVNVVAVPPGRTEQARFKGELPSGFADFVPELTPEPGDHVVSKRAAGAFTRTDLETVLKARGVTQVVIVGIATGMGVEATARQAHELGFNVTLAIDAMTDTDAIVHAHSIAKLFPRLGETAMTADILARIGARDG